MGIYDHEPQVMGYDSWEQAREDFEWDIPEKYNIATDLVSSHDDRKGKVALIYEELDGSVEHYTFYDLDVLSNRAANLLADLGVKKGDRVAINLPNVPEVPIIHFGAFKLGAVIVPLSELFGPDAIEYRLQDSGSKVLVSNDEGLEKIADLAADLPDLETLVSRGASSHSDLVLKEELGTYDKYFETVDTHKDDDAILLYTSGTTGDPKGVRHGHRYVAGYYPGFETWNNLNIDDDQLYWSPGGWAWAGGLVAFLYTAWHYGKPFLSRRKGGGFDPEWAFETLEKYAVTNTFIPPTALRSMKALGDVVEDYDVSDLENISVGGEASDVELIEWVRETLGADISDLFGQTEANMLISNATPWFDIKPGSIGKPVPGHEITLLDDEGEPVEQGEMGEIALKKPDPVMLKEYWNKPEKTEEAFVDDWMLTGDLAEMDEDGYYWYKARADDVIITAGYRISPKEVEGSIVEHESVAEAAVVGTPHDERGEIIKAFVQPVEGVEPSAELKDDISSYVKKNLAKYEYPREIEFVEGYPRTTTGKIQRKKLREAEQGE